MLICYKILVFCYHQKRLMIGSCLKTLPAIFLSFKICRVKLCTVKIGIFYKSIFFCTVMILMNNLLTGCDKYEAIQRWSVNIMSQVCVQFTNIYSKRQSRCYLWSSSGQLLSVYKHNISSLNCMKWQNKCIHALVETLVFWMLIKQV